MIDLDDPIWRELRHPYGVATEIPNTLRHIRRAKRLSPEFWDEFTNILCHQCSIGSASIAALPHLVCIAADYYDTRKGYDSIYLAALILSCAVERKNRIPTMKKLLRFENPKFIAKYEQSLAVPLRNAVTEGRKVLAAMMRLKRNSFTDTMNFLAIVAAFDLRADVSAILKEMRYEKFHCPKCEAEVSVHRLYSY